MNVGHSSYAAFRAEHQEALERLFVQVLRLCRAMGLEKLQVVALDGTKVAANAALSANRSYADTEVHHQDSGCQVLLKAPACLGEPINP